ncbi:MAG TPA: alpha/beta fold hydrolase [Chthoniobacterales bacterium]
MPLLPSSFHPPALLANGHVQTILPAILRRRHCLGVERERLELDDGDFLDLDWARNGHDRLAILSHGLEGCSEDGCIRGTAEALRSAGWDVLAWNLRGCGKEPNRLLRSYHSGETGDLGAVIRCAAASHSRIALVGFSLGGNVTLKYLGEARPHPAVIGGAAISVPIDLAGSAQALDQRWANRIYVRHLMKRLAKSVLKKAQRFPGQLEVSRAMRTFRAFDDRYTAPINGFRDAADYWQQASSRQYLNGITVPTLLVNARNDPFLSEECFPVVEAERNPHLYLEVPASGGHVGFIDLARGLRPWFERRLVEFLTPLASAT